MLVDTDVLIWYMRGHEKARRVIERHRGFCMSVVTYMELVQGMRDKRELAALRAAMRGWQAELLYLDHGISVRAASYVEEHFLSHSLQLADALIGATAAVHGLPLLTADDGHYRAIRDLSVERFRP